MSIDGGLTANPINTYDGIAPMKKQCFLMATPYFGLKNITIDNVRVDDVTRAVVINNTQNCAEQAEGITVHNLFASNIWNNGLEYYNCNGCSVDGMWLYGNNNRYTSNQVGGPINFTVFSNRCTATNIHTYRTAQGIFFKMGAQFCSLKNFTFEVNNNGILFAEEAGSGAGTNIMFNTASDGIITALSSATQNSLVTLAASPSLGLTNISNNTISGVTVNGGWDAVYSGNPSTAMVENNNQFINDNFYNQRANAFDFGNSYASTLVQGCNFYDCNMNITAGTWRIKNNTGNFINTAETFITATGGNILEASGNYSKGLGSSVGLNIAGATVNDIDHNTFLNYNYGVQFAAATTGVTLRDNILSSNVTAGLNPSTSTGNLISNNIGYNVSSWVSATNTAYTMPAADDKLILPVISAARTLTLPAVVDGTVIRVWNQNTSGTFSWSFATGSVKDATSTNVTALINGTIYTLVGNTAAGAWIKQ